MVTKSKSIGKNIIFKFILNLFNIIVPILIGPYVSRKLGVENMGIVNFSQSIFSYFFIFAGFGVYQYGLREISKNRDDEQKISQIFSSLFFITIATTLISTVLYLLFIIIRYNNSFSYTASMILTFNLLSNIFYVEWINEAFENFDFIMIKSILVKVGYTIGLFVLIRSSNNMKEYLYLLVISTFLNNFFSYIYIKKQVKFSLKHIQIKKHIKPMFMVVVLANVNVLYTQLDRFMLGEFTNMKLVGFYGIGQNVSYMITGLILTIIYATIPRLTNYSTKNDEQYIELLRRISGIYFLFLFPACIGMTCLSKEIMEIYGGVEFRGAYIALGMFSIYNITLGYESILNNQVLYVKGKEKLLLKIVFLGGILNLILNTLLLKVGIFTEMTAILTTMIANIMMIIIENIYIRSKMKLNFDIFAFENTKYFIISLIFVPIIIFIKTIFNGILTVSAISIIICSLIYFGVLLIIKDKIFNEVMQFGLKMISGKLKKFKK